MLYFFGSIENHHKMMQIYFIKLNLSIHTILIWQQMGGNSVSIEYVVPVSEKKPGETPVYRKPTCKEQLMDQPAPGLNTMKKVMINSFQKFGNNKCLGKIIREEDDQHIEYRTYKELEVEARKIGSAIHHEKLYHQAQDEPYKFIGLYSRNRPEWTIVDVACILYGCTSVPIYDTLGDENVSYVFNHTNLTTVFVNDLSVKALMKTKDLGNLKNIISFDDYSEQEEQFFKEKGVNLRSFSKLIDIGEQNVKDYQSQEFEVKENDCVTFSYTSGTTGPPKGAMISHINFTSFLAALKENKTASVSQNDVVLSYLPLAHLLERQLLYLVLGNGGTIVYFTGDIQKIKDDILLVKPTLFVSVPRLYTRFYDAIRKKFDDLQGVTKAALNYGLAIKLKNASTNGGFSHKVYDPLFFNKTKAALGGRVRLMISGSAPILPEVQKFMKVVMAAPFLEGYGQTESTGATFATEPLDPLVGHIGGPASNCEYKLVDIPEMKYTSEDKDEDGNSMPRGEIWMRGPCVFLGYYKDQQKTKQTITKDGWLKTGDVGAILPQNRGLKIIDRKKNIFKLQQGQYVASEKVENIYADYEGIKESFLYGDSNENYAISIAVPEKEYIQKKANEMGIAGSFEELCRNKDIRVAILSEMHALGSERKLKSFEQAKNIYLQPKTFQQKEIVTTTMKLQRHEAKLAFMQEIKAMYKEGMLPIQKKK